VTVRHILNRAGYPLQSLANGVKPYVVALQAQTGWLGRPDADCMVEVENTSGDPSQSDLWAPSSIDCSSTGNWCPTTGKAEDCI
jgi:hypothetical protein